MHRYETIDLGTYRGSGHFLVGFVEPAPRPGVAYDPGSDADEYGVALVRAGEDPLGDNVQVVWMDTAHGRAHLDRCYLPADADRPRKRWLEAGYASHRMKQYLRSHWTVFVDRYERSHG